MEVIGKELEAKATWLTLSSILLSTQTLRKAPGMYFWIQLCSRAAPLKYPTKFRNT